MKDNEKINIIIDQPIPSNTKKEKGMAYYAELLKNSKSEKPNTAGDTKSVDLNKLKEKKLLSVEEASELFGIGRNKIRTISNDKDCPFVFWIGSHRKIKREEFEKFLSDLNSI